MMTQDALKKNPGEQVVVEVDSAAPRDNILRLARRKKLNATVDEKDGVFTIIIGYRIVALYAPISALLPRIVWSGLFGQMGKGKDRAYCSAFVVLGVP